MAQPLVTIVTPTYNMAEFLETAIRSVAAQHYDNIEHIVVDGGFDDETPAIIDKYQGVVARYIREPDDGQSAAINKGFHAGRGELIAWVNADDYYFPEAVARAVAAFEAQPDLDLFYGNAVFVDRGGQFLRYFTEVEPEDPDRIRTTCDYICQPTTFFRRQTLERIGFLDEGLNYTMDWELWCRMAKERCRFHYERELIAANREYPETKTSSGGLERLGEILRVNMRYKTSLLPRAFLSFAHHDLPVHVPWSAPLVRSAAALIYPARLLKRALVGRREIPPLYGLYHHSSEARREVQVSVPIPDEPVAAIELVLELTPGSAEQRISVHANESLLGTAALSTSPPGPKSFRFGLNDADQEHGRLDLVLRAESAPQDSKREVCFLLEQVRLST